MRKSSLLGTNVFMREGGPHGQRLLVDAISQSREKNNSAHGESEEAALFCCHEVYMMMTARVPPECKKMPFRQNHIDERYIFSYLEINCSGGSLLDFGQGEVESMINPVKEFCP